MEVLLLRSVSLLLLLGTLFGGGCSFAPTAELKVFRESVSTANAAATPLLDEYSSAERKQHKYIVTTKRLTTFNPVNAAYFADIGDGPTAGVYRQAHDTLDRLSSLLLSLATGADVEGDMKILKGLVTETGGLLSTIPGLAGSDAAINSAFAAAAPVLTQIFREYNRHEALKLIDEIQQRKLVHAVTAALINATKSIFLVLVEDAARTGGPKYFERMDKVRLVLGNYVVLLNRVNDAWNEAADAARLKTSINTTALTERVAELRAAANATRRAFAEMHNAN